MAYISCYGLVLCNIKWVTAKVPNQGSMEEFQGIHRDSTFFKIYYTGIRRHAAQNKIHTTVHNP